MLRAYIADLDNGDHQSTSTTAAAKTLTVETERYDGNNIVGQSTQPTDFLKSAISHYPLLSMVICMAILLAIPLTSVFWTKSVNCNSCYR